MGRVYVPREVCMRVIESGRKHNKRIIVDPKGVNWGKYKGASVITPNLKEIGEYVGFLIENDNRIVEEVCIPLPRLLDIPNLLITRSEHGMSLIASSGSCTHFPVNAVEVYDVSGAGDTVVATITVLMKDESEGLLDAIKYANIAAGIVVGRQGTNTVTLNEINKYVTNQSCL